MVSAVPTGGTGYPVTSIQPPKLAKPEDQQQLLAEAVDSGELQTAERAVQHTRKQSAREV